MKTPRIIVTRGEVRLSSVDLLHVSADCVVAEVDCSTKRPELGPYITSGSNAAVVTLRAAPHTLRPDPTRQGQLTRIEIDGLRPGHWRVTAEVARYTVTILWVRDRKRIRVWTESTREIRRQRAAVEKAEVRP